MVHVHIHRWQMVLQQDGKVKHHQKEQLTEETAVLPVHVIPEGATEEAGSCYRRTLTFLLLHTIRL